MIRRRDDRTLFFPEPGAGAVLASTGETAVAGRWAEFLAALAAVWLYLPTLGFGFVFDDGGLLGEGGLPHAVGGLLPYRPLRYASYLVDYHLGGSPAVFHAHNIALHALVAALVTATARRLGCRAWAALAGGLFVAWHPLAVEAAAYVAGRRDLLCVAIGLASVLAALSSRRRWALVLLLASAAAKESGMVFAFPLLMVEHCGLAGRSTPGLAASSSGRVAVAMAASAAGVLVLAYGAVGPWAPPFSVAGLALMGGIAGHYVEGLAGLRAFAPEYPRLAGYAALLGNGDAVATVEGVGALLVLGLAAGAGIYFCGRSRIRAGEGAFVFAWTVGVLASLAAWGGLHEPGADRHAYLLLPPVGIGLAMLVSGASRLRYVVVATAEALVLLCLALGLATSAWAARGQLELWRSERTLWSRAAAEPLASVRAHANFARVLAFDGDYAGSIHHFSAALAEQPGDPLLWLGRAAARCAAGLQPKARRDLEKALRAGSRAELTAAVAADCRPSSDDDSN